MLVGQTECGRFIAEELEVVRGGNNTPPSSPSQFMEPHNS